MKNPKLLLFALILLTCSCIEIPIEPKFETMSKIKPSIFNAINFSSDFNRESEFYDPFLQRRKNIISASMPNCLIFEYTPDSMPEGAPTATITANLSNGSTTETNNVRSIRLDSSFLYFFYITYFSLTSGDCDFSLSITDCDDILYSEKCKYFTYSERVENNITEIVAYNDDSTGGYITSTYPACGYFKVSDLNGQIFANDKTEYEYSYGRKKILSSENYIKKRLTFINLSMYQQNLLKALCNCENLKIDGTFYYLVSDFTEIGKDTDNEVCDLQADFVPVEQSFFVDGADSVPSSLQLKNLFVN